LVRQVPYDSLKDFAPVARVASFPYVFAVHPSVPAQSLKELVVLGRAKPAELNYASFAMGQVIAETFKSLAGMDMNFVPYQGGVQATISVVGGHAPVLVAPLSDASPHILSGKLRALAVTSLERAEALREVPTVAESGYPGFDWVTWIGAAVPARTPKAVVERLSAAMLRAVHAPETKAAFSRLSISQAPMGAEEFGAFLRAQMRSYETTVRQANIKAD
jgi:tripartite-type tricarboxylate transporter receptor subunit TctC